MDLDFFAHSDAAAIEGGAVLIPLFDSSELFERRAAALLTQQQSSASSASRSSSFAPAFSASSSSSLSPSTSTGADTDADADAKDAANDAAAFGREIDAALARLQHAWTRRAWRSDSVEFSVPAHCAAAGAHVRVRCFVQIDRALMPPPSALVSSLSTSAKDDDDDDDDDENDEYDSADDELCAHDSAVDNADDDDYDTAQIGSDGGRGERSSQGGLRGRRASTSSRSVAATAARTAPPPFLLLGTARIPLAAVGKVAPHAAAGAATASSNKSSSSSSSSSSSASGQAVPAPVAIEQRVMCAIRAIAANQIGAMRVGQLEFGVLRFEKSSSVGGDFDLIANSDVGVGAHTLVAPSSSSSASSESTSPTLNSSASSSLLTAALPSFLSAAHARLLVDIPLVSLSIVDRQPAEVLFLSLHFSQLRAASTPERVALRLQLGHLQIDNMMPRCCFPVLFAPRASLAAGDAAKHGSRRPRLAALAASTLSPSAASSSSASSSRPSSKSVSSSLAPFPGVDSDSASSAVATFDALLDAPVLDVAVSLSDGGAGAQRRSSGRGGSSSGRAANSAIASIVSPFVADPALSSSSSGSRLNVVFCDDVRVALREFDLKIEETLVWKLVDMINGLGLARYFNAAHAALFADAAALYTRVPPSGLKLAIKHLAIAELAVNVTFLTDKEARRRHADLVVGPLSMVLGTVGRFAMISDAPIRIDAFAIERRFGAPAVVLFGPLANHLAREGVSQAWAVLRSLRVSAPARLLRMREGLEVQAEDEEDEARRVREPLAMD